MTIEQMEILAAAGELVCDECGRPCEESDSNLVDGRCVCEQCFGDDEYVMSEDVFNFTYRFS